ncbi:MAG: helix-turn-helix domain-containing protein [Beijerinckiaceae bacterium]|jgi:excisionase family DNA binding protein
MRKLYETPDTSGPLCNSVNRACERLGLGRTSLYELITSGDLIAVRIAGRTLIPEESMRALVEKSIAERHIEAKTA